MPAFFRPNWNHQRRTVCVAALAMVASALPGQALADALQERPAVQACAVLQARRTSRDIHSARSAGDLDTLRIQAALDLCGPGKAVVLLSDGSRTAFESAPLRLRRGVTLYIDSGVTLYASPNRHDYDLAPSSCGRAATVGAPGCKPFLFAYQAAYSGVAGDGTIDGQGGVRSAAMHGASLRSWWDLARKTLKSGQSPSLPDLVSSYESQGFRLSGVTLRNAAGANISMFKTIAFSAAQIKIDSPLTSAASVGILLSNSPDAAIENTQIRVPEEAVSIRASILGATSGVSIRDTRIFGGRGMSIGDGTYGDVHDIDVQNVVIEGAQTGLFLNLKGTQGGSLRNIRYSNLCMRSVDTALRIEQPDGSFSAALPAGRDIRFEHVVVAGKGYMQPAGLERDASARCDLQPDASGASKPSPTPDLTTIERPREKTDLIVGMDSGTHPAGDTDFISIQQAVDALPVTGGSITLKPGTYREVVTIRKPHVHLHGEDSDPAKTTIVFGNGAAASGGTFNTATVFVEADDVTVDHLTIANDLGTGKGQAVALSVTGDRAVFRNLRLLGAQDTLFAASKYCYGDYGPCVPARQYFADCYIAGNIDFLFGDSLAVFDRCELHGLSSGNVMYTAHGKHYAAEASGWVFNRCRLTAEPATTESRDRSISLGRPWRPYATVVYLNTEIDAPVVTEGWTEWPRFGVPSLPTAYYAEFNSSGPGARPQDRERYSHQLTTKEAERWSPSKFLAGEDGWNPAMESGK